MPLADGEITHHASKTKRSRTMPQCRKNVKNEKDREILNMCISTTQHSIPFYCIDICHAIRSTTSAKTNSWQGWCFVQANQGKSRQELFEGNKGISKDKRNTPTKQNKTKQNTNKHKTRTKTKRTPKTERPRQEQNRTKQKPRREQSKSKTTRVSVWVCIACLPPT